MYICRTTATDSGGCRDASLNPQADDEAEFDSFGCDYDDFSGTVAEHTLCFYDERFDIDSMIDRFAARALCCKSYNRVCRVSYT
jgi:hypothetical protein